VADSSHEARIQKLEDSATDSAVNIATNTAKISGLGTQIADGFLAVSRKIDDLGSRLTMHIEGEQTVIRRIAGLADRIEPLEQAQRLHVVRKASRSRFAKKIVEVVITLGIGAVLQWWLAK
jgi:hypothetical protein